MEPSDYDEIPLCFVTCTSSSAWVALYAHPIHNDTDTNTDVWVRAMAQAVSGWPLTAESWVRARVNPCEICSG
jgi:hypothetical protein